MIAPSQTIPLDFGDAGSITGHRAVQIRGVNPSKDAVEEKIIDLRTDENDQLDEHWYAQAIVDHESHGNRQFNPSFAANYRTDLGPNFTNLHGKAMPNFNYSDGWGIAQLDPCPTEDAIWNWHENLPRLITMLNGKRTVAENCENLIMRTYDEITTLTVPNTTATLVYHGDGYTTQTVMIPTDTDPVKHVTYNDPIDGMTIVFYNSANEHLEWVVKEDGTTDRIKTNWEITFTEENVDYWDSVELTTKTTPTSRTMTSRVFLDNSIEYLMNVSCGLTSGTHPTSQEE